MDEKTAQFYQTRAEEWAAALPHDTAPGLDAFLDRLPPGARILEFGCGDGRDAAAMEARGFEVDAIDGTPRMVEISSARLSRPARLMRFDELDACEEYDAVWAYASLLHVPADELPGVLARVHRALKRGGWHFASLKGGRGGDRDPFGRFYSYIPEADLRRAYERAADWDSFELATRMGGSYGAGPTPWHYVTARKQA